MPYYNNKSELLASLLWLLWLEFWLLLADAAGYFGGFGTVSILKMASAFS